MLSLRFAGVTAVALLIALGGAVAITRVFDDRAAVGDAWIHLSSRHGDLAAPGSSEQQTASLVLDIDGDGTNDFVIAARKAAPALVWYRRRAAGWERYLIEDSVLPIEAGGAAHDIDGDGDLDVVMGEDASGNRVHWWENPAPDFDPDTPWRRRLIKDGGANKHHDQLFGDFDADGEAELAFWNQGANRLFLAEIPDDPRATESWPYISIFESEGAAEGLAKADVDGDGTIDLVGGGHWFEHLGGTRFEAHAIDPAMSFTRAAAGQLVPGGRPEIVFVVGDGSGRLKWYEWDGGAWVGHDLLGVDVDHGHSLEIADFDRDGHLDIMCAEMHTPGAGDDAKLRIFYGDGRGGFELEVEAQGLGNHESRAADLDGDGDLDILVKPYTWSTPRVDVLLNRRTRLDRWRRHVVDADRPWRSVFIASGDLDGDGLEDLVSAAWWYRNPGRPGGAWERTRIGAPLNNMAAVLDLDGDGDLDILGTTGEGSERSATLVWAQNDGSGRFQVSGTIAEGEGDFLQGVAAGRFDGDALQIALSWHEEGNGIQLLTVPGEPAHEPWALERITDTSQDEALSAGDIDRDGRTDLLLGTIWLANVEDGWRAHVLSDDAKPDRNRLADMNGDGRLDAVVGFEAVSRPGEVAWYEQPEDPRARWTKHHVAEVIGPMSLDARDLDGDGDLDLVVGEHDLGDPERAKLYVFENRDGRATQWVGHVIAVGDEHHDGARLTDIDDDGDLDIVSIGWSHGRVLVYENRARRP